MKKRNSKIKPAQKLKVKAGRKTRTIRVDYLARIEGEGALFIEVERGELRTLQLRIFEPPRFFEAFLRGRPFTDVPDITSRICGICPVAYMMSSIHALERALRVQVTPEIRALRRLLYCGEWIESHTLHIYMLHAPDFLGYPDAISMAKDSPKVIQRGLQLKKTGNRILSTLGGREIHPINIKVGGFYSIPNITLFKELKEELKRARDDALETVQWVVGFNFPELERDYEFVSLHHPGEYPMNEGRIISNLGLNIDVSDYDNHFEEYQVPYSSALQSRLLKAGEYLVGPLARYNLNFNLLSPLAKETAKSLGFYEFCRNPFKSIVVRSIEVLHACDEAIRIIESLEDQIPTMKPCVEITRSERNKGHNREDEVIGFGATEAPRGLLYHRYKVGLDGEIKDAKITPPTSQNQKTIESDLFEIVKQGMHLSKDALTARCEQAIRNYDPCISCSAHFLKIEVQNV